MDKIDNIDIEDIDNIVKILNEGLSKGQRVSDLRKTLGISEKRLQRALKGSKYRYDFKTKQYVVKDVIDVAEDTKKNTTDVVLQDDCRCSNTDVVPQNNYNMATLPPELLDAINKMNEMYNWYEMQTKVVDLSAPVLKIIPNDNVTVTRSMRLYLDTYERFNAYCKANKDKKVQDILDSALREFLDKYEE